MSRLISDVRSEDGLVDNLTLNRLVKIMFSPGQSMGRFAKSFFKRKKSTNLRVLLLEYTLTTCAGITWLSSCRLWELGLREQNCHVTPDDALL